ncbi:MAG TPA: hypothetical protein V6D20_19610 [Candidatus Obscuribacterales bacterium]
MTQPTSSKNTEIKQLVVFGCFWAFLTGSFFCLPGLSPVVGLVSIVIAFGYSGAICWLGRPTIWFASGLTTAITIAYVLVNTDFSVINHAVLMTIILNFVVFGLLSICLRKTMSVWRSWFITAGAFGGSLGLGWLCGLILS